MMRRVTGACILAPDTGELCHTSSRGRAAPAGHLYIQDEDANGCDEAARIFLHHSLSFCCSLRETLI